MPQRGRSIQGGFVYHPLNRSNVRAEKFSIEEDYAAFERALPERTGRSWSFCAGSPRRTRNVWHAHRQTSGTGHLYQGRFKSFPVQWDEHLDTVLRYVERNPVLANLVQRAHDWRWSSAGGVIGATTRLAGS